MLSLSPQHEHSALSPQPGLLAASVVGLSKIPADLLFSFDRLEERLEVPFAEALCPFPLDDLVEERRPVLDRLREDLQEIPVRIPVDQDPELFEDVQRVVPAAELDALSTGPATRRRSDS